jgi:predicted nucleic acid-binding protein
MSVSANQTVVIKDACILFDLMDLKLLACFYQLNLTVVTTPEVIDEITDPGQMDEIQLYIDNGQLEIDPLGQYENMVAILDEQSGLSFTDASVLEAALRRGADILTSDKSLRNESRRHGLTVRGMLWILEELYRQQKIELSVLLEKLHAYPAINGRAPKTEIIQLIQKYTP